MTGGGEAAGEASGVDLIRSFYAAMGRRDLDAAHKLMADDLVFHFPGRHPLAGEYHGPDAWFALARRILDDTEAFGLEVHDVLGSEGHAVALIDAHAERAGRTLEWRRIFVYHLRDGKIADVWVSEVDPYAVDEFFSA